MLLRVFFLTAMSVAFCGLTVVLGSAPLTVLRNTEGRLAFALGTITAFSALMATQSYPLAIPFALSALLVFVFIEGLEHSATLLKSGMMALSLGSGVSLIGLSLYAKALGVTVATLMREQLEMMIKAIPQLPEGVTVNVEALVYQAPSAIVILMALSLWFGALFGKRFSPDGDGTVLGRTRIRDFDLPDIFVWALILALPGTFLSDEGTISHIISVNIFNVLAFCYFLKGLAIVATYFSVGKVGAIWQGLMYVVLISQLFLLVAVVGLLDVWMNFRVRLTKKSVEPIKR